MGDDALLQPLGDAASESGPRDPLVSPLKTAEDTATPAIAPPHNPNLLGHITFDRENGELDFTPAQDPEGLPPVIGPGDCQDFIRYAQPSSPTIKQVDFIDWKLHFIQRRLDDALDACRRNNRGLATSIIKEIARYVDVAHVSSRALLDELRASESIGKAVAPNTTEPLTNT